MFIKDFKNMPNLNNVDICENQEIYEWNKSTKSFESKNIDIQERINSMRVPTFKECLVKNIIPNFKTSQTFGDATIFKDKNSTDYFNAVKNDELIQAKIILKNHEQKPEQKPEQNKDIDNAKIDK